MAIWDNIGKKASATTAKAAQQVKILTETTKLNGMISDEEKKINNRYCEIGKLYATIHREDPETELADLVAAVVESERKIKEYRKPALERQLEKAKQEADQSLDFRKDSGEE